MQTLYNFTVRENNVSNLQNNLRLNVRQRVPSFVVPPSGGMYLKKIPPEGGTTNALHVPLIRTLL